MINLSDIDRAAHLLSRTTKNETGCMEFNGCVQANGYARATVRRNTDYAHRHIYQLINGDIPDGMDVCHKCDNRRCINPDHLFLGARRENMEDARRKGRLSSGAKHSAKVCHGELNPMAKLAMADVSMIRSSPLTRKELASMLRVSPSLIGLVRQNKIWRNQDGVSK